MTKELRWQILRASVRDRSFLKEAWRDVRPDDFPEVEEQIVARVATAYYEKYEQPIGPLLKTDVMDAVRTQKLGTEAKDKLKTLVDLVSGTRMELVSVRALIDRVKALRKDSFFENAVEKVITAHEKGELTAQTMAELVERARAELVSTPLISHDYYSDDELSRRILDRKKEDQESHPLLMIDPLDKRVSMLGPGRLGVVMAPPAGGKGLALIHFGQAYTMQGLNVVHFTLEDPVKLVEKRYDCSLTRLPLHKIRILPVKLKNRFKLARRKMRGRLRIINATDGEWTVSRMEQAVEQLIQQGFDPDAIIIDYDDEIVCEKQFKGESARRFEFSEIYKRLRAWAARTNKILWTAHQSTKGAVGRRIITMRDTSEDFSIIRKTFIALTIGSDPENPRIKYLFVAKHREDEGNFGVDIATDFGRAIFYDARETDKWRIMRKAQRKVK
jgi:replicative DNA helicase